ncbi:MAG: hypothetical protein PHW92_03870 [Lutibacter sp.]|nr:hypothetical protein [Lutibacter sp.]
MKIFLLQGYCSELIYISSIKKKLRNFKVFDINNNLTLNFKKMKNLENYGVQALNSKELKETEGGLVFLTCVAIGMCVLLIAAPILALAAGDDRGRLGQPY